MQKEVRIYIQLVFVALFWGGSWVAGRIVSQQLTPVAATFSRFMVATIFLMGITRWKMGHIPRLQPCQWVATALLGITGIVGYNILFFMGLKLIPAGRASLIVALNPIMIMLASAAFFNERLTLRKLIGTCLALTGATIVIAKGDIRSIGTQIGRGEWLILGCVTLWCLNTLISRVAVKELSPLVSTTFSCLFGTLGLLLPVAQQGIPFATTPVMVWGAVLYLGFFATVLGFWWYYEGVAAIGATRTAIFNNLVPVFGVLGAALVLHEPILWSMVAGGAMVIGGVAVTNWQSSS